MNTVEKQQAAPPARSGSKLGFVLIAPCLVLLWPGFYSRWSPELFGFPFFYWFQFAWVILTATMTAIVSWASSRKARS